MTGVAPNGLSLSHGQRYVPCRSTGASGELQRGLWEGWEGGVQPLQGRSWAFPSGIVLRLGAACLAARGRCSPPQEWGGDLGLSAN